MDIPVVIFISKKESFAQIIIVAYVSIHRRHKTYGFTTADPVAGPSPAGPQGVVGSIKNVLHHLSEDGTRSPGAEFSHGLKDMPVLQD